MLKKGSEWVEKLCDLVVVECDVCPRQNGVFFFWLLLVFLFCFQQMKVKVCFDLYNMHNDCHVSLIGNFFFFCFLCKNWHFCPLSEFFFCVDMLISFAFCFNWKITIFLLISINEILVTTKEALLNQLTVVLINKSVIFRNCVSTIFQRLIFLDAMFLVSMSISSSCFGSRLLWISGAFLAWRV